MAATTSQPTQGRLIAVLLALLGLAIGAGLGYWLKPAPRPAEQSADIGFLRDMIAHHEQAVQMAGALLERTDNQEMRRLAYDILTTQQGQIGMMNGWLELWGYPVTTGGTRMDWMGMPMTGLMPGMAAPEQIAALNSAEGAAAEILFMQLMIPHHYAGVEMAEVAVVLAKEPLVRRIAQSMVDAQSFEVDYMNRLLAERGAAPIPKPDKPMEMPGHQH